jgi:hypothetical protein
LRQKPQLNIRNEFIFFIEQNTIKEVKGDLIEMLGSLDIEFELCEDSIHRSRQEKLEKPFPLNNHSSLLVIK